MQRCHAAKVLACSARKRQYMHAHDVTVAPRAQTDRCVAGCYRHFGYRPGVPPSTSRLAYYQTRVLPLHHTAAVLQQVFASPGWQAVRQSDKRKFELKAGPNTYAMELDPEGRVYVAVVTGMISSSSFPAIYVQPFVRFCCGCTSPHCPPTRMPLLQPSTRCATYSQCLRPRPPAGAAPVCSRRVLD